MATAQERRDRAAAKYRRTYDRLYVRSQKAGSAEECAEIDRLLAEANRAYAEANRIYAEETGDLLAVGTRVAARSWGEGVVEDADATAKWTNPQTGRSEKRKPYRVRRDDGTVGHFHIGQIQKVEA